MEEPKDYVSWKTGKRVNRSGITPNFASLEIMVKMEGGGGEVGKVGLIHT